MEQVELVADGRRLAARRTNGALPAMVQLLERQQKEVTAGRKRMKADEKSKRKKLKFNKTFRKDFVAPRDFQPFGNLLLTVLSSKL